MLTQERLKHLLRYNPETGVFTWLVLPKRTRSNKGDIFGTWDRGYFVGQVDGVLYKLHRLAFLYMTGAFPPEQVDHINGVRSDNRWCNLRVCNNAENNQNRGRQANNKFGIKGVDLMDDRANPRLRGSICYTEVIKQPDGSVTKRKRTRSITRPFERGNERAKEIALEEVTTWLREMREKHHGGFSCDN